MPCLSDEQCGVGQRHQAPEFDYKEVTAMNPNEASDIPEVQGAALTELDKYWLATTRETAKDSIKALEEAAKQLIALTTFSQGLYFAAISFSDLKKALDSIPVFGKLIVVLILVFPLLFWLGSLAAALLVFHPKTYETNLSSPDLACDDFNKIVAYKHLRLKISHLLLLSGFVPLVMNILFYLLLIPKAN